MLQAPFVAAETTTALFQTLVVSKLFEKSVVGPEPVVTVPVTEKVAAA
jgi:hypothetical protein